MRAWARVPVWKALLPLAGFLLAVTAFEAGCGVRAYPEGTGSLLASCYYALSLFVMGGTDLGVPVDGPPFAYGVLWTMYFACPLITASAVIDTVLKFLNQGQLWVRFMRNHVVIAGCGRLALLYLEELQRRRPGTPVVVVDPDGLNPKVNIARLRFRVRVVTGDITDPDVLALAGVERARRLVALSTNDMANLTCLHAGRDRIPARGPAPLVGHVSDLVLLRTLQRRGLIGKIEAFNSYRIAAAHLVESSLVEKFAATAPPDRLLIVGFGRFGQTILSLLQDNFAEELAHVYVIDRFAERNMRIFEEQIGVKEGFSLSVHNGDIRDPALWREIQAELEAKPGPQPLVLLCTEDRASNLEVAIELSSRWPEARVVVRVLNVTGFEASLSATRNLEVECVSSLLRESFPEDWFR